MSTQSKPAEEMASSEPKPKENNGSGDAKPSAEPKLDAQSKLDALQKDLEKKSEEARDFKVPHQPTPPPQTKLSSSTHTSHIGQIHTHRRRLP